MDAFPILDGPVPLIDLTNVPDATTAALTPSLADGADGFDDLYQSQYDGLVRLAFVMVDTNADAEEVVQEAFAQTLSRWNRLDNPGAYLRRAVVNGCRDLQRRRTVRRRRPPEISPPPDPPAPPDHVLDAVRKLRPPMPAVVTLRFYEDLTVDQIADVLGLRPGTVKSHLHRALAELRKVVEL